MDDNIDAGGDEKEHEYIFRTLKDEKYRDLLQGIVEPLVESVLTSKLSDVENNIKRDVSLKLDNTVKSLVETNLKDFGVSLKRKKAPENVEDEESSNKNLARKKSKHCEQYEANKCESRFREYDSAEEAISEWRKMANNEWERARRTDLTEIKGIISVICLDTSESMSENNAWEHSKHFITNYLDSVVEIHASETTREEMVALVTFGKETKVQTRLTTDYDRLKSELETLKPEGPSPMFGGLVLSKAVAKTSDYIAIIKEKRILPKIIMITDGKPTDIKLINGPERAESDDVTETLRLIEEEAKTLTEKDIELHIVYVGKPDYLFLHTLKDCTGGDMMAYREADRMALNVFFGAFVRHLHQIKEKSRNERNKGSVANVGGEGEIESEQSEKSEVSESSEIPKILQRIQDNLQRKLEQLEKLSSLPLPDIPDFMEVLDEMRKLTRNRYLVVEDKKAKYPRIGSRVRRAKDWEWGKQDGNGPGTIIGHCRKEDAGDKQIWVWVEWDVEGRQNIYRYKTHRSTKADIKIVDEERVPPEDEILAVGMKVGIGPDYLGEKKARQGVVIKLIDGDDDDDDNAVDDTESTDDGDGSCQDKDESSNVSKAEVLWEDDERGIYQFGEDSSKVEIQPRIQYTKPDKPKNVMITDISDKEVCLSWVRPADCGGCSIKKYIVCMKTDKLDSKWCNALEVDSSETKATVGNLEQDVKYKFAVIAENKIGPGDMHEASDLVQLKTSICKPEPPAGPLNIKYVTKSSCTVCWNESPVCEKKPVTHYLIEIREAGKCSWEKVHVERTTSHKLTQLRKLTPYEIQVKSVNNTGMSEPLGIESFITKTFLDSDIPHTELQDKQLVEISMALAGDWQLLGHYLGLNNVVLERIVMQYKTSGVPMLIFKMLSAWRQRDQRLATFYKLIEGIEAVNAVTTDWDKIADVARKINETV